MAAAKRIVRAHQRATGKCTVWTDSVQSTTSTMHDPSSQTDALPPFEELHGAFVLLGGGARRKRTKVPPTAGLRVLFA
jgi:hypothetical protein